MIKLRMIWTVAALGALSFSAIAQSGGMMGKGKGGGSGSGGGSQSGGGSRGGGGSQGGGSNNSGPGSRSQQGGGSNNSGDNGSGSRSNRNRNNNSNNSGGQNNFDRGQLLNKKPSQSGRVEYNSQNNGFTSRNSQAPRFNIETIPGNFNRNDMLNRVIRQDRITFAWPGCNGWNDWRVGYWQYDQRWNDNFFWYPNYVFNPFGQNCVISPWYYYPTLPGYIGWNRINNWGCQPSVFVGVTYNWNNNGWNNGWNSGWNNGGGWNNNNGGWNNGGGNWDNRDRWNSLDDTLDDLQAGFLDGDRRAIGRLIPRRGSVNIFIEGRYGYSLNTEDFYDLVMDNIQTTRTNRYEIERVWRNNDGARVVARHEFVDPSGRRQTVWHSWVFGLDRRDLVVREFSVANRRIN